MISTDFAQSENFAWILRVLMTMADISPKELADKSSVPVGTIYNIRGGAYNSTEKVKRRLLSAIENWSPGVLEMLRAAETVRADKDGKADKPEDASDEGTYSRRQWDWVAERWQEGYTLRQLGDFLGLAKETVRRRFQRMGLRPYSKQELPDLAERKSEFNQLR